jgi:hypothetical protein
MSSSPIQAIIDLKDVVKKAGDLKRIGELIRKDIQVIGEDAIDELSAKNGLTDKQVAALKLNAVINAKRPTLGQIVFEVAIDTDSAEGKKVEKWAAFYNKGGIIKPKNSKYLAVPMRSKGGNLLTASDFTEGDEALSIKSFIDENIKRGKNNHPVLWYKKSKGGHRLMFGMSEEYDIPIGVATLVKSVTVKKTGWADIIAHKMFEAVKGYDVTKAR